jgi:hypothetical protein
MSAKMTEAAPRNQEGQPWYRRRPIVAPIALLVLLAGYAIWTNLVPYTLRASVRNYAAAGLGRAD